MDMEAQPVGETNVEAPAVVSLPEGTPDRLESVREAARALSAWRNEKRKQAGAPAEGEAATPPQDLAPEANAAPAEEPPSGETEEAAEPEVTLPPIDAPVSWTAEEKQRFAALPRETQEYISNRERARDAEIRRSQNEVAEKLKLSQQEQEAMVQARQQYENALPMLLQSLQSSSEFADIKSIEDVEKLARDDWPRYVQWDAHNKKVMAVQQEIVEAQQRQHQEYQSQWEKYANEQDRLFAEKVPEVLDPEKGKAIREMAINSLQKDYGFSLEEMQQAWNGPFRDARVQQILLDAARWRNLKANPPKPVEKPVPPVQRPGPARGVNPSREAEIQSLEQKLSTLTGRAALQAAAQLTQLRRATAKSR
jgi:hypothetical protein